jgi:hypothetical protein
LETWRQLNPSREVSLFFADYYSLLKGKVVRFENGKHYMLFSKHWSRSGSQVDIGIVVAALMREPEGFTEVAPPEPPLGEHPDDIDF